MKRFLLLLLITPSVLFAQLDRTTLNTFGDSLVEKQVQEKKCVAIAAALSIDGETLYKGGAGYSDVENKKSFESNTPTRIASIIKPMTAIAIMQLVEQNKIDLDEPIQEYIPQFPVKDQGNITVRQILSHTAGIPSYSGMKEIDNQINYPTLSDAVAIFANRDLVSIPGTEYHYTSYGYTLLGLIIEKVSGKSYEDYMQENIWDKAEMNNTGIEVYGVSYPNKSLLYKKNKDKSFSKLEATNLSDRTPGGGVYSTVEDVLKFGNAVLNNQLIRESTLNQMLVDPENTIDKSNYGLGWYVYTEKKGVEYAYGHTGSQRGASGQLIIIPEDNMVVVVLTNTSSQSKVIKNTASSLYLKLIVKAE